MIVFYLILLIMVNILLLGALVWMYFEKEHWAEKYQESLKELYPIQWDYIRERDGDEYADAKPEN